MNSENILSNKFYVRELTKLRSILEYYLADEVNYAHMMLEFPVRSRDTINENGHRYKDIYKD